MPERPSRKKRAFFVGWEAVSAKMPDGMRQAGTFLPIV